VPNSGPHLPRHCLYAGGAPLPKPGERAIGRGSQVGVVYRLSNGELVYVQQSPHRVRVDGGARFAPDSQHNEPPQDIHLAARGA